MLHCHRLVHEDEGMMAMEYVHDPANEDALGCSCGSSAVSRKPLFSIPSMPFYTSSPFASMSPLGTASPAASSWTFSSIIWLVVVVQSVPWIMASWVAMEVI